MWRQTLVVARKELREAVRDRRSLGSGLLYAVWGPMVMAIALFAMARDHAPDAPITLAMDGRTRAAALARYLSERSVTILPAEQMAEDEVRSRRVPVALIVHDSYPSDFAAARPAEVTLVYDGSRPTSRSQADRVRTLLAEYGREVGDDRLLLRGVSPLVTRATHLVERDLSTATARAARVLATLPFFLLVAAFVGGMGVAADIMAGERERGSLEALLVHPVQRVALVAGKWAATVVAGVATALLTLLVSKVVLEHPRVQTFDLPIGLSPADAARISGLLLPLTLMIAALQLLIALFARTYKEAQTHLSLLIFLPMLPGFLFAFGSIAAAPWMYLAPIVGQHVMISDIVRGDIPPLAEAVRLSVVTAVSTLVLLASATRLLGRESILRRLGT
jgi:sodium transport system permease protein